jgi:uncharacterized membrane protein YoaK (UPF0700 family)
LSATRPLAFDDAGLHAGPEAPNPLELPSTSLLLSFTGGFVDTCGFVALFGLFTAHVTGNFVLIGAAIAGHGAASVIGKLLALPVFVLTVAATRLLQLRRERRGLGTAVPMLAAQWLCLLAFTLAGVLLGPFERGDTPAAVLTGMIGVVTMAIQNTASRSTFVRLSPSTVMTGNVTQVAMDLVEVLAGSPTAAAAGARARKMWPPVAAFAVGALGGGLGYGRVGFWALLLPAAALLTLLVRVRRAAP